MPTWGDIRKDCVKETGVSDLELLSIWLNEAYVDLLDSRLWNVLALDFDVVTAAPVVAGTIAVTAGSVAITGTGTAWTESLNKLQIFIGADPLPYQFSYDSTTTGSLDRPWPGETATEVGYQIVRAFYPVPDIIKVVQWRRPKRDWGEAHPVDRGMFDPVVTIGTPRYWDQVDFAETGQRFIRVAPAPDQAYLLTFTGQQAPVGFDGTNASDSPLPFVQADALRWYVKGCAYRHSKRITESIEAFKMYMAARARMASIDDARTAPRAIRTASWMQARPVE